MSKKLIAVMSVLCMLVLLISPVLALEPGPALTTVDWLNFRTAPGLGGRVVDMIPFGSEVSIIYDEGEWCMIEWNGTFGFVYSEYLAQELPEQPVPVSRESAAAEPENAPAEVVLGVIRGDEVRFRQTGSLNGTVIGYFYRGIIVKVLEQSTQWTKVFFNDKVGYVASQYIRVGTPTAEELEAAENASYISIYTGSVSQASAQVSVQTAAPAVQAAATPAPTAQTSAAQEPAPQESTSQTAVNDAPKYSADDIIATAKTCLGVPYKSGGTSMKGFDCSGFTYYVFGQNGISLSRTATAQYKQGTAVAKYELQPGDLVFFTNEDSGSSIGHVGIYIGDGKLIHASSGAHKKIVVAEMDSVWFVTHYYGACRISK